MSIDIIQQRLNSYKCSFLKEEEHALREITQEVALAALGRTDFFSRAVFQGGTALRIFYALNRFSEDLDFILREPAKDFTLGRYLQAVSREMEAYGYKMEVSDLSREERAVQKIFLKDGAIARELEFQYIRVNRSLPKIRIKVEIDTNPPAGGQYETKNLVFPFASAVACQDESTLLAGKLHAALCREYVKGRDWYDLLFYAARRTRPNYRFLSSAMKQNGPWAGQDIDCNASWCYRALMEKIASMDWATARRDVAGFMKAHELPSLDLWDARFFGSVVDGVWKDS